jgi:histidine triad (HIT) family protein
MPVEPTIFHKILAKEIPASIVYEDDEVMAFKDIHPKARTHLLFVPKQFVESIKDITEQTAHLPGMLILKAQKFAQEKGIGGYKLTFHVGKEGGQEVMYLHLHFLSEQLLAEEKYK